MLFLQIDFLIKFNELLLTIPVVRFAEAPEGMADVVSTAMARSGLSFQRIADLKVTDIDTPDSGYFEMEGKSRKKNFISS